MNRSTEAQFSAAMAEYGLAPCEVIADGIRRRFDADDDKRGKKSAWYVLYGDGIPAGAFGNWRTDLSEKWCGKSDTTLTPIERDAYRKRIEQARADAEIEQQALQATAATDCINILASARDATDDNPYCVRKGIKPYGLKEFKDKRTLIVPIRDCTGTVTSLQFIDANGGKMFKSNARIQGCYCSFGGKPTDTLLLCEGFATGASLHQVSRYPIAVAFNAGNLVAVAKALRAKLPDIRIIVCADNDRFNQAGNVGLTKATAAAHAVGGLLALPIFQSDDNQPTDFNDLHQIEGAVAVQHAIEHAVSVMVSAESTDIAALAMEQRKKREAKKAQQLASGLPYGFTLSDKGVFFTPEGTDEKPGKPMRICSPLHVTALVRDSASTNWGRVINFNDADGVRHEWAVPMEMLAGDGADMRRELARLGLAIAPSMTAKNRLSQYLIESAPRARARCVVQTGWFGNVFVMPDRTIGEGWENVLYQSESKTACQYAQVGTLEQWRDNVGLLCSGNSRLIFAASASFAGMVLHHAGQDSGGIHFVGSSSTGKSTAQLVAASVYGSPAFKQSWRATGNALEGTCAMHNDAALILDEMAEVDPREVGSIVYMIGNGTGKGRANRTGDARQRKTWRLMIVSSGEIGLAQHMRDGGKTAKAGQEVRMIDIAADAGAGHGLFEELHGYEGGAKFSVAIKEATQDFYGTPAIAFLERLTRDLKNFPSKLKQALRVFVENNLPEGAGGQAERVCNKFAVIAVAGEYATDAGITGWQGGDAVAAAESCFASWLESRGGGSNQERAAILSSVKAFFESHGESRFTDINDPSSRITINRAGFRQANGEAHEYFVLPEAYKRDICAGFDMKSVTKTLVDAGWVVTGEDGKASISKRLPELGKTRCYAFTSKMWGG